MKTRRHQSFTILLPVNIRRHPMIIVNTSHQNFDNSIKIAAENSYSILPLVTRTISHTSSFTSVTKIHKKFPKNSKPHVHTLLHKQAFMLKYFPNKLTKTPFDGYFLIIWFNGPFSMLKCSKTSLVEKTGYRENGETRNRCSRKGQIVFVIK